MFSFHARKCNLLQLSRNKHRKQPLRSTRIITNHISAQKKPRPDEIVTVVPVRTPIDQEDYFPFTRTGSTSRSVSYSSSCMSRAYHSTFNSQLRSNKKSSWCHGKSILMYSRSSSSSRTTKDENQTAKNDSSTSETSEKDDHPNQNNDDDNPTTISSSEEENDKTSSPDPNKNPILSSPFPWRLHTHDVLFRLQNQDDYSGMEITPWARFIRKAWVALEMNVPWWDILFTKDWEKELAANCAFAFQMAVCGLLSHSFQVRFEDIYDLQNTVDTASMSHIKEGEIVIDTTSKSTTKYTPMTDEERNYTEEYIGNMLEEKLCNFYKNIAQQVQIKFSFRPLQVRLENAFMIPHLTRTDVKADPSLQGAYIAIEHVFKETKDTHRVMEMGKILKRKTKHMGTKRSLIVDVSVLCEESLQLRDASTGHVIYGDDDKQDEKRIVTHLIRFEMETSKGEDDGVRELGSWQIIDIDDMLEGNIWH